MIRSTPTTDLGPMVDEAAVGAHARMGERGARRRCPSPGRAATPDGRLFGPTVLVDVPTRRDDLPEEVFAPVVNLFRGRRLRGGHAEINDSHFGLQCGVFTSALDRTLAAHDELEVGGVIVNDVPTWRTDAMPYGGVKDSGLGREGAALDASRT